MLLYQSQARLQNTVKCSVHSATQNVHREWMKPTVQLVSVLGLEKPGPVVGKLAALARDWQFSHPEFHPRVLQEAEPQSLPPDALVEYMRAEYAAMQAAG